jgi:hypothetical protein
VGRGDWAGLRKETPMILKGKETKSPFTKVGQTFGFRLKSIYKNAILSLS